MTEENLPAVPKKRKAGSGRKALNPLLKKRRFAQSSIMVTPMLLKLYPADFADYEARIIELKREIAAFCVRMLENDTVAAYKLKEGIK